MGCLHHLGPGPHHRRRVQHIGVDEHPAGGQVTLEEQLADTAVVRALHDVTASASWSSQPKDAARASRQGVRVGRLERSPHHGDGRGQANSLR